MSTDPGWAPRPWPEADAPPIKSPGVTLIAKRGRGLVWAVNVDTKRQMVGATTGPLWAAWTGQWQTHLFEVPRKLAREELGLFI
jgi:hypothetical protein